MVSAKVLALAFAGLAAASNFVERIALDNVVRDDSMSSATYECHADCGYALLISQETSDYCSNSTFTSDYEGCLECAGPDNEDLWQYYGADLAPAAASCGLVTTPDAASATATSGAAAATSAAAAATTTAESVAASTAAASTTAATASATATAAGNATSSAPITQATGAADRTLPALFSVAALLVFGIALA